jgi:hypothetical protein
MPDYVLLAGAKKNVGDFLIGDRGRRLLEHYRPDRTWETWDRFASVDSRLEEVNRSRAILLLGGPAYAADFYPGIYPLSSPLSRITVPIVPLAVGWSGGPTPDPDAFSFTSRSVEALRWIHDRITRSSCRDDITQAILQRHGLENVVVTGCTAWHHLPSIGRAFHKPALVRRLVVTTGAHRQHYRQNVALLKAVRARFPDAARYCVFHRGIGWDRHSTIANAIFHGRLARAARRLEYEVVDAAYDLGKIDFYHTCDLHVGYRVHAHLFFLSVRRPSFLISEDGRGVGASLALKTEQFAAWDETVIVQLMAAIDRSVGTGFDAFDATAATIDAAHMQMRQFIQELP